MISKHLFYRKNGGWVPLPEWGRFFIDFGYALATSETGRSHTIVGFVLPMKSYAASFMLCGLTLGKLPLIDAERAAKHFEMLCGLRKDIKLIYRTKYFARRTIFKGIRYEEDGMKLLLQAEKQEGGATYVLGQEHALNVEIAPRDFKSLPNDMRKGFAVIKSPFLSEVAGDQVTDLAVQQSRLDCVLIGQVGRLKAEILETTFAVKNNSSNFVQGTLQDILQVRRFIRDFSAYRSDIYNLYSKDQERKSQENPYFVVFDGAKSFLDWKEFWPKSHWIVLLDQTETEFSSALEAFNTFTIKNFGEHIEIDKNIKFPHSIPATAYEEMLK